MAEGDLLLPLLRFVALVAPAVAILMQVVNDRDSGEGLSVEFEILQLALSLIIIGGLIIGYQFVQTIQDPQTFAGTILIFGSLPLLAVAIWWRNLPAKIKPPASTSPSEALGYLAYDLLPMLLVFVIPFAIMSGVHYALGDFLSQGINIGFIANLKVIPADTAVLAILTVLSLKTISITFSSVGLPPGDFWQAITNSGLYFVVYLLSFSLFVAVPYVLVGIVRWYFGLPRAHMTFNFAHIWTVLILLLILRSQLEDDNGE